MITQSVLKTLMAYAPDTGVFTWKKDHGKSIRAGTPAGSLVSGYIVIGINYKKYYAHRLAWLYMVGSWPGTVDHINRCKSDNRWTNLREVTCSENGHNTRMYKNNTTGVRGVTWAKSNKQWRAEIRVNNTRMLLGYFRDKQDAINARRTAEAIHHPTKPRNS